MKNVVTIFLTSVVLTTSTLAEEWMFTVYPKDLKVVISDNLKTSERFKSEHQLERMICLSRPYKNGPMPPYRDNKFRNNMGNIIYAPYFAITEAAAYNKQDGVMVSIPVISDTYNSQFNNLLTKGTVKYLATGEILLRDNYINSELPSSDSKRKRISIGIQELDSSVYILIYVNTSATIKDMQNKMAEFECKSAMTISGEKMTSMLYMDGQMLVGKPNVTYPNVLTW